MKYGRLCVGPTSLMIWQALLVLQWVPRMKVTELYMWQAYKLKSVYVYKANRINAVHLVCVCVCVYIYSGTIVCVLGAFSVCVHMY